MSRWLGPSAIWVLLFGCQNLPHSSQTVHFFDAQAPRDAAIDLAMDCVEDHQCKQCVDGVCVEQCAPPCGDSTRCEAVVGECQPCAFRSLQTAIDTMPAQGVVQVCPGVLEEGNLVFDRADGRSVVIRPHDIEQGYTLSARGAKRLITVSSGTLEIQDGFLTGATQNAVVVDPSGTLEMHGVEIRRVQGEGPGAGLYIEGALQFRDGVIDAARCVGESADYGCAVYAKGESARLSVHDSDVTNNTSGIAVGPGAKAEVVDSRIAYNRADFVADGRLVGSALHVVEGELRLVRSRISHNQRQVVGPINAAEIASFRGQLTIDQLSLQGGRYVGLGICSAYGVRVEGAPAEHLSGRALSIHRTRSVSHADLFGCDEARIIRGIGLDADASASWPVDVDALPSDFQLFRPERVRTPTPFYCPPGAACAVGGCVADCPADVRCSDDAQCASERCAGDDPGWSVCGR